MVLAGLRAFFSSLGIYIYCSQGKGGTSVRDHIYERVLEISHYIASTGATVRQAAQEFSVSKSTVHKDMAERLPKINPQLAQKVRAILDQNKAERHLRGGAATRKKYLGI